MESKGYQWNFFFFFSKILDNNRKRSSIPITSSFNHFFIIILFNFHFQITISIHHIHLQFCLYPIISNYRIHLIFSLSLQIKPNLGFSFMKRISAKSNHQGNWHFSDILVHPAKTMKTKLIRQNYHIVNFIYKIITISKTRNCLFFFT